MPGGATVGEKVAKNMGKELYHMQKCDPYLQSEIVHSIQPPQDFTTLFLLYSATYIGQV